MHTGMSILPAFFPSFLPVPWNSLPSENMQDMKYCLGASSRRWSSGLLSFIATSGEEHARSNRQKGILVISQLSDRIADSGSFYLVITLCNCSSLYCRGWYSVCWVWGGYLQADVSQRDIHCNWKLTPFKHHWAGNCRYMTILADSE